MKKRIQMFLINFKTGKFHLKLPLEMQQLPGKLNQDPGNKKKEN